ncbi:DUF1707 SHOCT-like domain-containing protein [Corynebacterium pacaense]|uniref:DUF1707 SHOCT-like domain-containing protein n=1 Tax=Corynebacterium pacaense TaxID=1816684 RepID=UPI0009BA16AF|nr:DUF1707 domain-containing protein [Corynebacterium pacaense]
MGTNFPGDPQIRVSDNERSAALAALGQFYAEGRLSMAETDERCAAVAEARTRADLNSLFTDLPQSEIAVPGASGISFSAHEVAEMHRNGARPRAGILGLSTVLAVTATAALAPLSTFAPILLAIIPIVFILLYVMKVGPRSWYAPSPQQLERERLKALRVEEKQRELELRAQRRERTHALTTRALDVAQDALEKRKPWK